MAIARRRSRRWAGLAAAVVTAGLWLVGPAPAGRAAEAGGRAASAASAGSVAEAARWFPGCSPAGTREVHPVVGRVDCLTLPSRRLGGTTAVSYFVPPSCAPRLHRRCPVLYLLHGFSGDYTSMLGTAAHPSPWVAAVDSAPPVPPERTAQPWTEADPTGWRPAPGLDLILVAPDGRTTPGGFGPAPGYDGYWADWNPRYARGGAAPAYPSPPPRFATYLTDELMPWVRAHFPTGTDRGYAALAGTSLGGYGSMAIGLRHPDHFAALGAVSGIMNILLVPGLDPTGASVPVGVSAPASTGYRAGPGRLLPLSAVPGPTRDFLIATYAFGDPSTDGAYYRGYQPVELADDAAVRAPGGAPVAIDNFSNDAVPRRSADLSDPPGYLVAQGFESLVLATNMELNHSFGDVGASYSYALHPGIHSDTYWNPWLRQEEEALYSHLRHGDGSDAAPTDPARFDYRSIEAAFSVWGWHFAVQRPNVEFLQLNDVSCSGLTLRGSGRVQVDVPAVCGTGWRGHRRFEVELGPSLPTDAPAGADASPFYGHTVSLHLEKLDS